MRKTLIILLLLLLAGGTAVAADKGITADLSLNYGKGPYGFYGSGWGTDVGVNIDFNTLGIKIQLPENMKLQARASVGCYSWSDSSGGRDYSYRRYPLDVGGRVVYTLNPKVKAHGDVALEGTYDKNNEPVPDSEFNPGLLVGIGISYSLTDQLTIGANLREHFVSDAYYTLGITLGVSLP